MLPEHLKSALDLINIGNPSEHPLLSISEFGKNALIQLGKRMSALYAKHGVVTVRLVRMFGKGTEEQVGWLRRMEKEDVEIGCIAGTIASIIASEERQMSGSSESSLLAAKKKSGLSNILVAPISITVPEGQRFWTAGINGAVALLEWLAEDTGIPMNDVIVFSQSFETEMSHHNLSTVYDSLLKKILPATVRITPGSVYSDAGNTRNEMSEEVLHHDKRHIIDTIVSMVHSLASGKRVDMNRHDAEQLITLDRNTLGFHFLSDLVSQGGAHPASNEFSGMEDTRSMAYTLLQIFQKTGESGLRKHLKEHFNHVVTYRDTRLEAVRNTHGEETPSLRKSKQKVRDEVWALEKQFGGKTKSFQDEPTVPDDEQDFAL